MMYCPSKKKQGTMLITANPAENIVMYLQRSARASGSLGFRNEYFGIQSDTSTVLYMSAGCPKNRTSFPSLRFI